MTVIELREHAQPIELRLDEAVGRALAASGIVKASPDPFVPGVWRLSADRYVGSATVVVAATATLGAAGGTARAVTVRIVPKVSISRLFFLLGYALNPRGWREDQVELAEHPDLLPALAHAFERQAERALRQGLLQGYRRTEESAWVVRGRLREAEQLRRRFVATLPVEIEYDEFTTDIPENQILRAAVDRLLRLPGIPAPVRRRLLHQRSRLQDASPLTRGVKSLPAWSPSRLNARYVPALRLAEIILRGGSVEHDAGTVRVDGFLVDMAKIFEDFVTVAIREQLIADAAGSGDTVKLQARHHLDEAGTVLLKPDLVWYDAARRPLAVIDAKYKAEKPDGFPGADLYQLLAYCTVLGLPEGHLVYAKGNAAHADHVVRRAGIRIHQHALDLQQPPDAILAQIVSLVRHCEGSAARPSAARFVNG